MRRERVGNRKEQAPCDDASAIAKEPRTKRSGFGHGAESGAREPKRREPDQRTDPQDPGGPARYIEKHEDTDAPSPGADQTSSVDLSDRIGAARQRKAHDDARKEKRNGEAEREFRPSDQRGD